MSEYIMNKETGKIELHFDKSDYMALPDEMKRKIKSNYLWSRYASAWVSRAKFPHLYHAEQVAKEIGLTDGGSTGERLTFEEQMERKQERAENRAERMEYRAEAAERRGEALQKPITDMHGDISFFTQPNINTSAGRAFTRKRNRMWESYERGMDEFKKSAYYQERAEAARNTAKKPTDKAFCMRRIAEAEKTIRAQKKNIDHYEEAIRKIEAGEIIKNWRNEVMTIDDYRGYIDHAEEILETAIEKAIYYQAIIDDLGGIGFSKDNLKPGYLVRLNRFDEIVKVRSCGTKNIKYEVIDGRCKGWILAAAYAEIKEIISTELPDAPEHPFVVGDTFTVERWDSTDHKYVDVTYTVTKITNEKVTLKCGDERAITRRPRRGFGNANDTWVIGITDGRNGCAYKKAANE